MRTESQQAAGTLCEPPPQNHSRTVPPERRRAAPHAYAGWQRHRRQEPGLHTARVPILLSHGEANAAPQRSGLHPAPGVPPPADGSTQAAGTLTEPSGVLADERQAPAESPRRAVPGREDVPRMTRADATICNAYITSDPSLS